MKLSRFPLALTVLVLLPADASRRKDRAVQYRQYDVGPDVGNVSATLARMEQSLMNAGSDVASGTEDSSSDDSSGSKADDSIGSKAEESSGSKEDESSGSSVGKVKSPGCPASTETIRYRGATKGVDISGCGLTSCGVRYRKDRNTPEKCRDVCAKHGGCKSFSFASPGADRAHARESVCSIYPTTRATGRWGKTQVLCKVKAVLSFKVKTMIQAMQQMVRGTMLPKIFAEQKAAQRLADRVYRGFATCSRMQSAAGRGLGAMLRTRRSIGISFKRCRKTQAARAVQAKTCTQVLVADNRAKAAACSALKVVQKDPRKEWVVCKSSGRANYGAWVTGLSRVFARKEKQYKRYKTACDKASRKARARAKRCAPFTRSSVRTRATCDARQDQLEQATCSILTRTQSACQKYMPCFAQAKATSVRELRDIRRLARIRRAQFAEALRLECLLGHGCKANAKQIKECARRAQKKHSDPYENALQADPFRPHAVPVPGAAHMLLPVRRHLLQRSATAGTRQDVQSLRGAELLSASARKLQGPLRA